MVTTFLRAYNFGIGFLAVGCTATATAITLLEGDLDNFPAPTTTHPYRLVIGREVMEVTARDEATNRLTVRRAQEGTASVSHASLALVSLRLTAEGVKRMQDAIAALEQSLHKIEVRVNDGVDTGQQPRINIVGGAGITVVATNEPADNEVRIVITSP